MSPDNVIAFPGVRASTGVSVSADPVTLILGAVAADDLCDVHRQIGLNDRLSVAEVNRVLRICFGWGEPAGTGTAEWALRVHGDPVAPGRPIGDLLVVPGDRAQWVSGRRRVEVEVLAVVKRDAATPEALCIGGDGLTGEADLDEINAELTGEQTIRAVLARTRPEVRDLVDRSGIFDFVPLLQALDLGRSPEVDAHTQLRCAALPVEPVEDRAGRDAALTTMLCLAALADDDTRAEVTEFTMASLGWVDDDGAALSLPAVEALCPDTLAELRDLGLVGTNLVSPMERVDLFREVFRGPVA